MSRHALWSSSASLNPRAAAILDHYYATRPSLAHICSHPSPERIAAIILSYAGSAPGLDGHPYELHHHCPNFTTRLIQAAFTAAHSSEEDLHTMDSQESGLRHHC